MIGALEQVGRVPRRAAPRRPIGDIEDMLSSSPAAEAVSSGPDPRCDPGCGPDGSRSADAGGEVCARSDAEFGEDVPEVGLDGLDADVELGRGLPVGVADGDQAGHCLLGGGETNEGGCGFWPRGRASSGELPVAGLQVGPGAQGDQALPGRAQPGDRGLGLADRAQPTGVGDLELGQCQWRPQALGAAPGGLERRGRGVVVPGRGGQVTAQPGRGDEGRGRVGRGQDRLQLGQRRFGLAETPQADEGLDLEGPPVVTARTRRLNGKLTPIFAPSSRPLADSDRAVAVVD